MQTFKMVMAACVLLISAGCGSVGDIFGGGDPSSTPGTPGSSTASNIRGSVRAVDMQARTLTVAPDAGSAATSLRNNDQVVVSYDSATVVEYQGRTFRPEDLEVGDRIDIQVERNADRVAARHITVLSDVSGGNANAGQPNDFDGTVRRVDSQNRIIEVSTAGNPSQPLSVSYDANTRVEYQGRTYRPEELERGDGIRVRTRPGNGLIADTIVVLQNVSDGITGAPQQNQLRGTVRSIDTNARTIQLDGVSWAQGFNRDPAGNATRVGYDGNTIVEFQGQRYGIANIEPGDLVDIEVVRNGSGDLARRIVVVRSA